MLALQQSARKTGVHDVDAMVVAPAGSAGGRAIAGRRAGHRDTP